MTTTAPGGVKTVREVLVANLRLDEMASQLPDTVFPMKVAVEATRTEAADDYLSAPDPRDGERKPVSTDHNRFPYDARVPVGKPYIPRKTVWFDNPVEFPDSGDKPWPFREFVEYHASVEDVLIERDAGIAERIYLGDLHLAELVPQSGTSGKSADDYLHRDETGTIDGVTKEAFEDNIEVAIARFDKRPKLSNESVREALGTASPGRVLKPLRLQNITLVRLKEHRGSSMTTAHKTKRRYYTKGQADKSPKTGYVHNGGNEPFEWESPSWDVVQRWLPRLSGSEFVKEVEFEGYERQDETFVEEDVRFISH